MVASTIIQKCFVASLESKKTSIDGLHSCGHVDVFVFNIV